MFYASQRKFRIIMNKVIEKYTEHFAQNQNTWKEKKKKKKLRRGQLKLILKWMDLTHIAQIGMEGLETKRKMMSKY